MPAATPNVEVIRQILEAINLDDMASVAALIAPDFIRHDLSGLMDDASGPGGATGYLQRLRTAFPDLQMTIEDIFGGGDRVVARITVTGTWRGELLGVHPTGRSLAFAGVNVYRLERGQLAETWQLIDWASVLRSGAAPGH